MTAQVKVVHIEATTPIDAIKEIKAKLGDQVPNHILLQMLAEMAGRSEASPEAKAAGFDMEAEADRIAALPKEQRAAATREATVRLGQAAGLTAEESAELAAAANERMAGLLKALGMPVPDWLRVEAKTDDKPSGSSDDKPSDEFFGSIEKIHRAGYDKSALQHIRWFNEHQKNLIEALAALGEIAIDNKHKPSAQLALEISSYILKTNEFMYSVFKQSEVDPRTLGFKTQAEWEVCLPGMEEARKILQRICNR